MISLTSTSSTSCSMSWIVSQSDCTIFIIRFRPLEKLAFLWSTLLDKRLESSQIAFTFHFQRQQSLFDLDVAHLAYHFGEVVLYPGWSFEPGQVAKYLVARRRVAECSDTYYWLVSVHKLLSLQMGHERIQGSQTDNIRCEREQDCVCPCFLVVKSKLFSISK